MVAKLVDVSLTSSVLVRSSIATVPRSDSSELPPPTRNEIGELARLRVIDLDELRTQRLQGLQRLQRFELGLLACGDLLGRRDDDDVAVAPHVETLGRHDDVERLIPRHVLQPQRHAALHGVADDDVEAAEVSNELQHRARLEILEVQGQPLAAVLAVLVEHTWRRSGLLRGRLELEGELIVGLIGDLVVVGGGRDDQPRVLVRAQGVDREHRRREIGDVEPTHQLLRQGRVLEVDHDSAAFLTNVHGRARVVELHDDLARAVGAAAEIDIADRAIAARCSGGTRRGGPALTLLRGERRGGACTGRLPD